MRSPHEQPCGQATNSKPSEPALLERAQRGSDRLRRHAFDFGQGSG